MGFSFQGHQTLVPHWGGGGLSAPVADFSADDTTPAVDQSVQFTDLSTNDPDEWMWDFGDGGTSTDQNPTHAYTKLGAFTVSLTVTNAAGDDTETKVGYIVVTSYTLSFTGLVAFPAGWTAPNWTVSANTAKNTPTQGSELVTNGNMEAGSPPGTWVAASTILSAVAEERSGGSGVQSLSSANDGAVFGITRSNNLAAAIGSWVVVSGWYKKITTNANIRVESGTFAVSLSSATWIQTKLTDIVTTNPVTVRLQNESLTNGQASQWDDVSVKPLSALIAYRDFGQNDIIVKAAWTVGAAYQSGVIALSDGTLNNCLVALYNRGAGTAVLRQYVGGSMTQLISVSTAYSAGADVEIRVSNNGTVAKLYYNGVQVGGDQTPNAAIRANTYVGLFSTDVSSTVPSLSVAAN